MFTWTVDVCPKTGNITSINQLTGKKLPLDEPKIIRSAFRMSVLVNAKDLIKAHEKSVKAIKQTTMYENF